MQKLNRSRFFSRYGDSLPIFFKKMEKEKPQLPQREDEEEEAYSRREGLFSQLVVGGGRAYVGVGGESPSLKVKPFVVK